RQEINDRLPAALPDGVVVAHKTGNLLGLAHDAGIIFTPSGPRIVVAMTWDAYDEDANAFIANVGALVYSAVLEPPANARYSVPRAAVVGDTDAKLRVTVTVANAGEKAWAGSAGRGLSALGAATASFDVKTHLPFLVNASVNIPIALHRGEASLLVVKYVALATTGIVDHNLILAWQAIDVRTSRTVIQGTTAIGVLKPGADGFFYAPFLAPNIRGSYKLTYELREGDVAVSETATTNVTINQPRTYPDDEGGRTPGPITITPQPTPRLRIPFPSPTGNVVPSLNLPSLPTPRGKPTPTPR